MASSGYASSPASTPAVETCLVASKELPLGVSLPRIRAKLKAGQDVNIIAIGSSSTRGVGASDWAATYPAVMQRELTRLNPKSRFAVVNSGVNGEAIPGQLERLDRDVLAARPDLVIWQLGANDVIFRFGSIPGDLEERVIKGIAKIRESGADVILMDLQNAPVVTRSANFRPMLDLIAQAARKSGVGHFRRYELFTEAMAAGVPQSELVSWDNLHSTDVAYDCVGRAIARSIQASAR